MKLSIGIYILPFPQRRPYSLELFIWYRNDWFLNKFHSRVKFMLHSHDRIKQLDLRHSGVCGFRTRSDAHVPPALALHNWRRSLFSVYMIPEWHFVPAQGFQSEWKPEWTHSGMTGTGTNFCPGIMWRDTKKYMEMEWTRSEMKVVPVSCKQLLRLFNPSPSLHLSRYLKGHKIKCFKPLRKREHPQNIWYFPCPLTHILINSKYHQT